MKIFKICIYVVLGWPLLGCASHSHARKTTCKKEHIVNEVVQECGTKFALKHQLVPSGSGGAMMYKIKDLSLAFHIYRPLSRDEARAILLDCAREVIETVHQNEKIQTYLMPGGFNEKSVRIQIYIHPNRKRNSHPDIGVCSYHFGNLSYDTRYPDKARWGYQSSESETYEDALALHQAYLAQSSSKFLRDSE